MRTLFPFLLAPVLGFALPAQVSLPAPGTVIGLTSPDSTSKVELVLQDMVSCKQRYCAPASFPITFNTNGGAAYDPIRQGVWIAEACKIACVDPLTCEYICKIQNPPWASKSIELLSECTEGCGGLAFWNETNTLFMADSRGFDLHWVALGNAKDPAACEFKSAYCNIAANFPKNNIIGGLAIDQNRKFLFVGSYGTGTNANVHLYIAPLTGTARQPWCGKLCELKLPEQCPRGTTAPKRITGLAFDSCRDILYVTDSELTTAYAFSVTGTAPRITCTLRTLQCCKSQVNGAGYHGLAVMPDRASKAGKSCTASPCNACPGMEASVNGDPVVGNLNFALTLKNAPTNAGAAVLGIGFGPCVTPGIGIGFCQNITITPVPPLLFFMSPTAISTSPCAGGARLAVPIKAIPQVCGIRLSAQWVLECRAAAGIGNAVSNCVQFVINSN